MYECFYYELFELINAIIQILVFRTESHISITTRVHVHIVIYVHTNKICLSFVHAVIYIMYITISIHKYITRKRVGRRVLC